MLTTHPLLHTDVHDGDGPFLLLVHGMLSSRAHWLANLPALSAVARPVVVELLGHGRSPTPVEQQAYRPEAYVRHFEEVREWVEADRWLVCGHSLGAALTLRYVLDHPDVVMAHVFTNSQSALADEEWRRRIGAQVEMAATAIEQGGRDVLERNPLHPARARHFPPDVQRALVADFDLHEPAGIAATMRHTVPGSSVREQVAGNRVPSLLTVGRFEEEFAERRRFAARHMPALEIVDLDAGHAVNIQAADGFNSAVTDFLGGVLA